MQITPAEPSVSTALRRFTSAPRRASVATPTASASVIVGSSPSGTFATISPIAKLAASFSGSPAAKQPIGRNASPTTTATSAISHATRRTCCSSGLGSVFDALGQGGDPAELGLHPGGDDQRLRLAADAARAAEDDVARLEHRARLVHELRRAVDRLRLSGQRREVDLERPFEQPRVGRDAVPFREEEHVAGDELPRLDLLGPAVPHDASRAAAGSVRSASIARSACRSCANAKAAFRRIDARRSPRRGRACRRRRRARRPPRGEARADAISCASTCRGQRRASAALQLVGAVRVEPPRGLAAGQAFGRAAQLPEELGRVLARVGGWVPGDRRRSVGPHLGIIVVAPPPRIGQTRIT